jgi:hypothetical protein
MDGESMTALRQALTAGILSPTATERRRARRSFEHALERRLAARKLKPVVQRR